MISKSRNKLKGDHGEDIAVAHLEELGHTIIKRNYRKRICEIDIISVIDQEICFTEVKSWAYYKFSDLEYIITEKKKRRMRKCTQIFLSEHPEYDDHGVRCDLLFLSWRTGKIEIITNFL